MTAQVAFEHTPSKPVVFHEYANLNVSQRAMIAAKMVSDSNAMRKRWMRDARASFIPSPRECCAVCGKYQSISQAHHVYPLSLQYADRIAEPCHDHIWLCPTHHAVVHQMIDALIQNVCPALDGVPATDRDQCDGIALLFVEARVFA